MELEDLDSEILTEKDLIHQELSEFCIKEDISSLKNSAKRPHAEMITIYVKCAYPDPSNPGQVIHRMAPMACNVNQSVSSVTQQFIETCKGIPNQTYYLGYDQLLFREGTLHDCGITHGKNVELYAPGKNYGSYHNQGVSMIIIALIPFILSISSLLFAITTSSLVVTQYHALFLFIGLLLFLPSVLSIILGLILLPECRLPCYFSGTDWC